VYKNALVITELVIHTIEYQTLAAIFYSGLKVIRLRKSRRWRGGEGGSRLVGWIRDPCPTPHYFLGTR